MQNAPLQNQALQQNVQAGALDVQQKQQQLADQKAMTAAMQQWDGKDYNDLVPLVTKNGGSAQAVLGLKAKIQEQQVQASTIAKNNGEAGVAQLTATKGKGDEIAGALGPIVDPKQTPDAQLVPALQSRIQDLQTRGLLDPQHAAAAQQLIQSNNGDPTAIRNGVDQFRKSFMAQSQIADEAVQAANVAKDTAQAAQANAAAAKDTTETNLFSGPLGEAKYRAILQQKASGQPLTQDQINFARGYEASNTKTTTAADSLGVTSTNTNRPGGLASVGGAALSPGGSPSSGNNAPSANPGSTEAGIVDQIGQYRANPTLIGRLLAKHPEILNQVQQKYPDWDQTTYNAKNKMMTDYTSGKTAQSINAMNVAVGHLSALDDAATALNNGDIQGVNRIANALGVQVGATPKTTYDLIVHRVGPELTSAYIQGGGGEGERQANAADFSSNQAPQQIHNNVATSINLFRSKIDASENQYKNTVGRDDFEQRFITPAARAAFAKYAPSSGSGGAGGPTVTAPNGKIYNFKDQASADAFKQKAGIQ